MEIIYLKLGDSVASIKTETLKIDQTEAAQMTKAMGASPLQALIDGTEQTTTDADGNIVLQNQALLDFTLMKHLTI